MNVFVIAKKIFKTTNFLLFQTAKIDINSVIKKITQFFYKFVENKIVSEVFPNICLTKLMMLSNQC